MRIQLTNGQALEQMQKRAFIWYDWARARLAVLTDWFGPQPLCNDSQFERVFRITRDLADRFLEICGNASPLFQENRDATGKQTICLKAKLLYCLKLLAYDCSPSAFQDYFQMGLTTIWKAFVEFTRIIATSKDLCQAFLEKWQRQMYDMSQQCI